jgi:hypothetical protein
VWSLFETPKNYRNVMKTKWIFKNTQDANETVIPNKARLVAQGYSQVEDIYYGETFAPMACLESMHILLVYASHHNFKLQQMDVKSTFVNGTMNELAYVKSNLDMLKRFKMDSGVKGSKTPMPTKVTLDLGPNGKEVDQSLYRSMIGSLLYLCASRPDIMLSVGMCACF